MMQLLMQRLIFVRGDRVAGLTTAATVWLVTGIGMACGAGLLLLAVAATVAYFIVALVFHSSYAFFRALILLRNRAGIQGTIRG